MSKLLGQAEVTSRRCTVEEYMALKKESDMRHEFFEGEVFAMFGGSIYHNHELSV